MYNPQIYVRTNGQIDALTNRSIDRCLNCWMDGQFRDNQIQQHMAGTIISQKKEKKYLKNFIEIYSSSANNRQSFIVFQFQQIKLKRFLCQVVWTGWQSICMGGTKVLDVYCSGKVVLSSTVEWKARLVGEILEKSQEKCSVITSSVLFLSRTIFG